VNTLKYQKPEVQAVVSALDAVQGMGKEILPHPDNGEVGRTVAAYEADE